MLRRLFPVAAAAVILVAAPAFAEPKPLTFEALHGLVTVREPQISPDGSRVVYVRAFGDLKANRNRTELALVEVASGVRRVITHDRFGVHSPRWSPSGDRIAYLASPDRAKPPQLYVLPLAGGDSEKITEVKGGIDAFDWRPDGNGFAYLAQDDPPKPKTKAPEDYVASFAVTDEHFLTREPPRPSHVWTIAADGTGAKQITKGDLSPPPEIADIRWTRDSTKLIVPLQPDAVFAHLTKTRTYVVDVATGNARPVLSTGVDGGGVVSHDGKRIALPIPRHGSLYLHSDVSVRDLADGHEISSAAALDRNVRWFDFTPDDKTLLIATMDGVRRVLWRYPLGGMPSRADLGDVEFAADATVAHDGTIAFVGPRRDDPGEIYVLAPNASAPRKLTGENAGWLVGHASFWRAAVAGAGVYDWTQQAVLADINEQFGIDLLGGATPWTKEGRAAFAAESPITYASAIRTPLLILSDTGDQRVPIAQSYALYHALRARGRTVKFVAFPRAGHFPSDPVGRESVMRMWSDWFDRWMK